MTKIVDSHELTLIFGIHKNTIANWIKEGCPVYQKSRGRGGRHQFNIQEVVAWREQRAVIAATGNTTQIDMEEAKRRKVAAEAGIVELELARKKGQVADLEEVERKLSNKFAQLSSRLRKVPERVVMQVLGETDEVKVKKMILREIDECLTLLAEEDADDESE